MQNNIDYDAVMLSVIIVNFNGIQHLAGCLSSLEKNIEGIAAEVIIVDNASEDGSSEYIRNNYAWVKLIESPINLGFTGGNNLGASHAQGKYLLLLNNDTVVLSSFQPMLEMMERSPNIGALGCQLNYADGRLQESIGYEHTPVSIALSWTGLGGLFKKCKSVRRTVHSSSSCYLKSYVTCEWVSGACLMTPMKLWKSLEGLDEKYFMYVEDVDYCKRLRLDDFDIGYTGNVKVIHFEGSGRTWIGQRALLNTMRSYKIYCKKFFGFFGVGVVSLLLSPILLVRSFLFGGLYILNKDRVYGDKLKAYLIAAYTLLSGMKKVLK